jgi:diaminopimelate decarboxylase
VGSACGTHGRGDKSWLECPKKRDRAEKLRRRWEDEIKMHLREINLGGRGGVQWTHVSQDRVRWRAVVNTVMNLLFLAPRS